MWEAETGWQQPVSEGNSGKGSHSGIRLSTSQPRPAQHATLARSICRHPAAAQPQTASANTPAAAAASSMGRLTHGYNDQHSGAQQGLIVRACSTPVERRSSAYGSTKHGGSGAPLAVRPAAPAPTYGDAAAAEHKVSARVDATQARLLLLSTLLLGHRARAVRPCRRRRCRPSGWSAGCTPAAATPLARRRRCRFGERARPRVEGPAPQKGSGL